MLDPKALVFYQEGYIYVSYGHFYVMREGLTARNWEELEREAQDSILSRQWSSDSSPYHLLTRELAQRADFPPRPSEIDHYNQLLQEFDIVPFDYDDQGRLLIKVYTITEDEQRDALEMMKSRTDISPRSIVERYDGTSDFGWTPDEIPWTIRLQEYLDMQQRMQDRPHFDFGR